MVMTREEVFRASGPTSGAHVRVKIGAKKDGRIVAAEAELKYQAGAFAGSPVQPGCMCAFAPYDLENVKVVGYDVVTQPAEGRGLSRAGRADLGVRGRERDRRDRRQARHRPDRAAPQERGQAGHQGRLRPEVRTDRHDRDAGGRQGARALAHAAGQEPGPRRRLRLLVQHRRRDVRVAVAQRGRHAVADRRHARHRRPARLAVHDGGRGAGRGARQDPRPDRRHRPARLQLPHRRQPRHLLERHGDGGGRARGHEGGLQARRQAVGAAGGRGRVHGRRGASGRAQRRQARRP